MPIQYRQLQAPALVDTTPLETGGVAAATSLARTFKSFSDLAGGVYGTLRQQQGQQEGAKAGASGEPGLKSGFSAMTAYGEAYNNAATRSYAIKAEADAEDQAARLQVEAGTDPSKFNATFSAVRDATVAHAPPEARRILMDTYNQRLGSGLASIAALQAEELKTQARVDTSEGVARATERIGNLLATNDPASHAQADEEQVKLNLFIDGAKNDGTFSDVEAQALHRDSTRAVTQQTVVSRFRAELANPAGDPVGFIERLKKFDEQNGVLPPAEKQKLENHLLTELEHFNTLEAYDKRMSMSAEKLQYQEGDKNATSLLLSGQLTQGKLLDMVTKQQLEPATARTLLNELEKGDEAKDDPKVAFDVKTNLLHYTEQEIATQPGLTWKTRSELILKQREESEGWKKSQAATEGEHRIDRALGIVPGTMAAMLTDEQKTARNQALTEWYSQVDALPADQRQSAVISASEDVIGRYIRKNKAAEAQNLRARKADYMKQAGDPSGMSKNKRASYDAQITRYDTNISAAEAEAARK